MSKFRTIDQKKNILISLFKRKPKVDDRILALTDEQLKEALPKLYRWEPLWELVDELLGQPLTEDGEAYLWNEIAQGISLS